MDRTGAQTMLYLTCIMIYSEYLGHDRVSHAKDWVSVDCCTRTIMTFCLTIIKTCPMYQLYQLLNSLSIMLNFWRGVYMYYVKSIRNYTFEKFSQCRECVWHNIGIHGLK